VQSETNLKKGRQKHDKLFAKFFLHISNLDEETTEKLGNKINFTNDLGLLKKSVTNISCLGPSLTCPEAPPVFIETKQLLFVCPQEISWLGPRQGVSSIMESAQHTVSQLLMQHASTGDLGNYTCQPAKSRPASITLHVLQGKCSVL
jgi:hypothetical protein